MEFLKDRSVLIADDDEEIRAMLDEYLRPFASEIYFAADGLKALKILRNHRVDLTILDINMPEMDGFELLGKIRWNFPSVSNIVISGDEMGEQRKDDILFQGYDFLIKPFDREMLFVAIRDVFDKNRGKRDVPGRGRRKRRNAEGARIKPRNKQEKASLDRSKRVWLSYYRQLVNFRASSPDRWPRYREVWRRKNIGFWCSLQRKHYRKKLAGDESPLTDEQIDLLSGISFPWTINRETWMERYEKLKRFREKYPDRWPRCWGSEQKLGVWCSFQRTQFRKNSGGGKKLLSKEKIELLNLIKFPWIFKKDTGEEPV